MLKQHASVYEWFVSGDKYAFVSIKFVIERQVLFPAKLELCVNYLRR